MTSTAHNDVATSPNTLCDSDEPAIDAAQHDKHSEQTRAWNETMRQALGDDLEWRRITTTDAGRQAAAQWLHEQIRKVDSWFGQINTTFTKWVESGPHAPESIAATRRELDVKKSDARRLRRRCLVRLRQLPEPYRLTPKQAKNSREQVLLETLSRLAALLVDHEDDDFDCSELDLALDWVVLESAHERVTLRELAETYAPWLPSQP